MKQKFVALICCIVFWYVELNQTVAGTVALIFDCPDYRESRIINIRENIAAFVWSALCLLMAGHNLVLVRR